MNVYSATYILNSDNKGNLIDWFVFEQEKDDKWEKRDYGYFYPDGFMSSKLEDSIRVNNSLYHIKNEKFFDKQLSETELKELELQMKKECVVALDNKRKQLVESISNQINYIIR